MLHFEIKLEDTPFLKQLNTIHQNKEVPYLASVAMNTAAYQTNEALKTHFSKTFTERNAWGRKGHRYKKSNKTSLVVELFHKDKNLTKQEAGGTVRNIVAGQVAIPTATFSKHKVIPKKQRASVVAKTKLFKGKRAFLVAKRKGRLSPGVYASYKRGLKKLYRLFPFANYSKRWGFAKTAHQEFEGYFKVAFEQILSNHFSKQ